MKPSIVLCPVDFSAPSRTGYTEACDIARESGATLVLLHVHEPLIPPAPEMPIFPAELILRDRAERVKQLSALRAEATAAGVREVKAEIVDGAPWDGIVSTARSFACQLIVMATHGRTGLRHVLLGSVAEKVVRHAPCSVLVVRSPEAA